MIHLRLKFFPMLAVFVALGVQNGWAHDLRITFPRSSHLTPVQRLNREGVEAVRKHQFPKAEALFYKAYLYDSADPFTLNNLGYISELQGKLDRAKKFYALASEQDCNAVIALSSAKQLQGKPMTDAFSTLKDLPMQVNRMNVEAIELLSENRNIEAELMLRKALALQPDNIFTLNNLGVAEEATGDFPDALKYYDETADSHSKEPVIVTLNDSWRGKPISRMAADSAKRLRSRLRNMGTEEARATMLTMQGVSATNQNDWTAAKRDFLQAYSSDPGNAFALNNLGYVAERDGDLETAQFYYSKARNAAAANARIGLATQSSAQGQPLAAVAADSNSSVDKEIAQYSQAARRQTGPVELIPRGNNPAKPGGASPNKPPAPAPSNSAPETPNSH